MTATTRGFTLVEVLVAMAIFALVALMAGGMASASLDARNTLDQQDERLRQLQAARALMKADFAQVVWRPTRDAYGARAVAGMVGAPQNANGPVLTFVRGGWTNPGGAEARSSLQYIEYAIKADTLVRRSRPYLDPSPNTPVSEAALIEGVENIQLKFYAGGAWVPEWRPRPGAGAVLPEAVSVEMTVMPYGVIRQLYMVPPP